MSSAWRIPALVRAVVVGLAVGRLGTLSWASEWQLTAVPRPTIWQSGIDRAFLANLAMLAVAGIATVIAFRGLFRASREPMFPDELQ